MQGGRTQNEWNTGNAHCDLLTKLKSSEIE